MSNETYVENTIVTQRTCENRASTKKCSCERITGCICNQGYLRTNDGRCVLPESCPVPVCGLNEEPSDCIKICAKTCKTRFRSDGRVCRNDVCKQGCKCIEGYLRHDNGSCVPTYECCKFLA
ncbi:hypothetical protein JYU34_004112 [Plutella xylostella]|uniref:TIL domain-containing protein n=1 Tax=Plutella xylostella TaxID=51655 RepID=A0ABQ7QX59_PLUXY|nr:hypothetical protein JYU34_004112 [Plutella xylostella]